MGPVRRFVMPLFLRVRSRAIADEYSDHADDLKVDYWLRGQWGNDYATHRRRVNSIRSLKGSSVLIAGCGTGRDVPSWLPHQPSRVEAIDLFNYGKAWDAVTTKMRNDYPGTRLLFRQANLEHMVDFPNATFDVVGSDALFEHVKNLPLVLKEFYRILKPQGLVYATFGPLWYAWGGDHISGFDALESGFNHLLLDSQDYRKYLAIAGAFSHSEHDGRTWVENDLFSRLKPREYLEILDAAGFDREFVAVILDPRAEKVLGEHHDLRRTLLKHAEFFDLVVTGMTVIYRRP